MEDKLTFKTTCRPTENTAEYTTSVKEQQTSLGVMNKCHIHKRMVTVLQLSPLQLCRQGERDLLSSI